jgi:hypothetical protein
MFAALGKVTYNQLARSYYLNLSYSMRDQIGSVTDAVSAVRDKADSYQILDGDEFVLKGAKFARYAVYATIALGIISAILTYRDIKREYLTKQLPIPKYIVDNRTDAEGNNFSINYKAVECNREEIHAGTNYDSQTGTSADLMADEGQQWLVVYVSRNSLAGNPILADFAVQESSAAPSGLTGNLHIIGERGAVNIASGTFRRYSTLEKTKNLISDKTLYMFYGISDTPKTYDESSGNMTATDFSSGTAALFGFGGLAIGAVLGAVFTNLLRKKKETEAEAA